MQIEIERQRTAVETNRMMVNNEIMERREAEYISRKQRERQELLDMKEKERLEMKAYYEQQIALERRLAEEEEKRLKSENQVRILLERKEPPLPPMSLISSRPAGSAVSTTSVPVFAKPTVPHKPMIRNAIPPTGPVPRMATGQTLANKPTLPISVQIGQEAQLKQGLADRTAKTAVSVAI